HQKGIELMTDVFGQYSSMLKCDGFIEMIERQEKYLYDLVTSVKNWQTFGLDYEALSNKLRTEKKRSKPSDFLEMAQQMYTLAANPGNNAFGGNAVNTVVVDEIETELPEADWD